jgi:hypothetical protein
MLGDSATTNAATKNAPHREPAARRNGLLIRQQCAIYCDNGTNGVGGFGTGRDWRPVSNELIQPLREIPL